MTKSLLPRSTNFGLTYASEFFKDDLGSQLQRLYGVYVLARYLNVPYIHEPLRVIDDPGKEELEKRLDGISFVELANKIFDISSDTLLPKVCKVCTTTETTLDFLLSVKHQVNYSDHFHLMKLRNPLPILDQKPELWNFVEEVYPFEKVRNNSFLKIAIHLNAPPSSFVGSEQKASHDDFARLMEKIIMILKKQHIPFECELVSEDFLESSINGFEQVTSFKKMIKNNAMAVLKTMTSADIFMMNSSTLSFMGGLFNQTGVVITPSTASPKLSRWMIEDHQLEKKLEDCCKTWKQARELRPSKTFFSQPTHTAPPLKNLALTYNNEWLMDGAGSQLCRIYGIYALAREQNIFYYHSPLKRIGYQGVLALEKNEENLELPRRYNKKFQIPSDINIPSDANIINLTLASYRALTYIREAAEKNPQKFFLVKIGGATAMVGKRSAMLESVRALSPFQKENSSCLRVAIHVRWGDLPVGCSQRLLPNKYYIDLAKKFIQLLSAWNIPHVCELYTELPARSIKVTPDHYGMEGRLAESIQLDPAFFGIEDFEAIPHLKKFINDDPIETLEKLATSDILIMSRSAFSYLAAMFNQTGMPVYTPFEYPPMPGWLHPLPLPLFEEQLEKFCNKWKEKSLSGVSSRQALGLKI